MSESKAEAEDLRSLIQCLRSWRVTKDEAATIGQTDAFAAHSLFQQRLHALQPNHHKTEFTVFLLSEAFPSCRGGCSFTEPVEEGPDFRDGKPRLPGESDANQVKLCLRRETPLAALAESVNRKEILMREKAMDRIPFKQLPMIVRIAVWLVFNNVWWSLEEFVIDRIGLWKYMPYYKVANACVWDLAVATITALAVWRASGGRTDPRCIDAGRAGPSAWAISARARGSGWHGASSRFKRQPNMA